ncbi:PDZ domain-containing protein [Rubrivirga litoralis]|uniref:PDZ domain-containing protein n=1 Tax=Rubrivirga litoralis TaxID=3075598 RepID=A0ABU3BMX0_9BACT|nr:PDZ domain-containing protein [Rubrivirga sp. F394]MDT0630622.1 PDZ domain-containing protein [Rubrivirga sp. F394]
MSRPARRLRRKTWRARRRWHRMVRPLRRPARVLTVALMLAVIGVGFYALYQSESTERGGALAHAEGGVAVLDVEPRSDAEMAGLQSGDHLASFRGRPVTPALADSLDDRFLFAGAEGDSVAVEVRGEEGRWAAVVVLGARQAEDAERFGLNPQWADRIVGAVWFLGALAFALCGLALFVRARARGYLASLGTALLSVAGGAAFVGLVDWDGAGLGGPLLIALGFVSVAAFFSALPAITSALVRFPDGLYTPAWTRHTRRLAIGGIVSMIGLFIAGTEAAGAEWLRYAALGVGVVIVAVPAIGLFQKYRRTANPEVRQQMKWVLLPLGAFLAIIVVASVGSQSVAAFDSERTASGYLFNWGTYAAAGLAFAAIPLGVLAGVLHFRPWDADLWIARSAAVGAATLVLTAVFAGGVEALRVGLQSSFGAGAEPVAGALAAVVSLAAFNPVREWFLRRADADLHRTREVLCDRLPLVLTGRQVVAPPAEVGRVAMGIVRSAFRTERAAVFTVGAGGAWSAVACAGVAGGAASDWAACALLPPDALPAHSVQVWEDGLFVLRVPLRSVEGEAVGVLALGTHGRGRGYSTEERKALDGASFALAEALLVSARREAARATDYDRLAGLVARFADAEASGDGQATEPGAAPPRPYPSA